MDKRNLAFGRTNFILLAIGFAIVVIGFVLMGGPSSSEVAFEADIFSARRIKVAPVVCFIGFISMIYAVIHKPRKADEALTSADATAEPGNVAPAPAAPATPDEHMKAAQGLAADTAAPAPHTLEAATDGSERKEGV